MSLMRLSWHLEWVRYTTDYPLKCLVTLSNHRQMDFSQQQKKEIYRFVKNNIYSFSGNKLLTIEGFTRNFLNLNLYTSITFIKSRFWIRYKQRYNRKLTFVMKSDFLGCVHLFTLYRINIVWTVTVRGGISHQTSCRRGWCTKLQFSLLNIYFRIGGLQAWLMFTLHRRMEKKPIRYVTIQFRSLRSVTKIAPPQPFLCVNRSLFRYDFRDGAKTIWCRSSVNKAL